MVHLIATGYKYGVGQLLVISFASHTCWWGSWQWDYESWWTGSNLHLSGYGCSYLVCQIQRTEKCGGVFGRVLRRWYLVCIWVMLYEGCCWRWHKKQLYLGLVCHAKCWRHSPWGKFHSCTSSGDIISHSCKMGLESLERWVSELDEDSLDVLLFEWIWASTPLHFVNAIVWPVLTMSALTLWKPVTLIELISCLFFVAVHQTYLKFILMSPVT